MIPDVQSFSDDWIAAWNAHDLEHILTHYAEPVEVTSPMIQVALGIEAGTLRGKQALRHDWSVALRKVPDLHVEWAATVRGIDSLALYYQSSMDKRATEVMFFGADGKIQRVIAPARLL